MPVDIPSCQSNQTLGRIVPSALPFIGNHFSLTRLYERSSIVAVALLFGLFAGPVLAEDVIYPGAPLQPGLFDSTVNSVYPIDGWINNTVTVNGGEPILGNVAGGVNFFIQDATISGNVIRFNDGVVSQNVIGAVSNGGTSTGNKVFISGGSILMKTSAGIVLDFGLPGSNGSYQEFSTLFLSTGNTLTITGGSVSEEAYGGYSVGSATNNQIIFSGGSVGWAIAGGLAGGNSGGPQRTGIASGNSVVISGGSVGAGVQPLSPFLPAPGVYGGASLNGAAINNTVTVSGNPDLTLARLVGGYSYSGDDAFTGNTLNVREFQGTVEGIQNFQNYYFLLPASLANGDTMLSATTTPPDMTGATVNMDVAEGGTPLAKGDSVILISNVQNSTANASAQGRKGLWLRYDFDLATVGPALTATVSRVQTNPQLKALSEGYLMGLASVNQGADLLFNQGIRAANHTAANDDSVGFAAFSGGSNRYNTGSHVDVDGFSMMAGIAHNFLVSDEGLGNALLLGVFFEAGKGQYDTFNSFSNAPSISASGDTSYTGGGILARYGASSGVYLEASARAGEVESDFNGGNLRDATGRSADYDSSTPYYGTHAGLGYLWQITKSAGLDISTRYIWTHQDHDSVKVLDNRVDFDDADSQRWRNGVRFSYAVSDMISPYIGAAYDYEFDGKAGASAYGSSIDAPDLKGGTGIGELGLAVNPMAGDRVSLDFGVQGYTGVNEGVTGSAKFALKF
ncbi:autotransporter outer membrane beta-barrel domain-containing protein [Budvicia diplopodorum]|uniref:autotransporter outer membrane beta-barrel domain-containing protein n=1 Tax=Budvicia diplopodorum TaxID=1119056 RepID=UPI0013582148|nr:autotransporter outer membrane beta-barrel domain-containing protein [Budvicia diplopodorum]